MAPYTIVVTGANRGLGLELAKQLSAKPNALVIGTARDAGAAKELRALSNTKVVQMDIGDYDSIKTAAKAIEEIAPQGIDELWNNAGISSMVYKPTQLPPEEMLEEIRINAVGPTVVTQTFLPLLRKKQSRKIWFISSIMGSSSTVSNLAHLDDIPGAKFTKLIAYSTSKAALTMVAVNFWGELNREGFIVQPIHPGWVKTDMGTEHGEITKEVSVKGMLDVTRKLIKDDPVRLRDYAGNVLEG